ncbi:hypothetical protein Skr01_02830 [Sphaerisporangium krabiense]|uniref:Uncharacterized protein n=1 Tax=Sphaerisporangium krabiense TaxID=763782 RepID=A0A7W8Z7K1_9ACTN|nr:hypothetical protein [Sphaerisporangium krabiense]GII60198.1 hypothetical protein Skr01_02830 [Sphaerisporangium krabiense]
MNRSRASTATRLAVLSVGLALIALAVYFIAIGLDKADKLASVLSALTGLAGLALSWQATMRRPRPRAPSASPAPDAPSSSDPPPATPEADGVRNIISGSVHGPAIQGRDFTGPMVLGPHPATDPPTTHREDRPPSTSPR